MLNWCKNSTYHDDQSEIFFGYSQTPPLITNRTLPPPKFTLQTYNNHQTRRIKPQIRKGIKTHFDRPQKLDKEVQVLLPYNSSKCLVDYGTQTAKIGLQVLNSRRNSNSLVCSVQVSPKNQNENSNSFKIEKSKYTNMLSSNLPKSIDYKYQVNKQTKATYCLADSKDKGHHYNKSRFYSAHGVESYHFALPNRCQLRQENTKEIIKLQNKPKQQPPYNSLHRIDDQIESQLTFSGKYRKMLKNVESQFKLSEKKRSEQKFKQTPQKRLLFYERQTIVSKYDHQKRDSQRSLVVEQSILYQPEIRSYFTPLTHAQQHDYYSFYLAKQNFIGMLVSIKQITINHMNRISEQLLIYKELETRTQKFQAILELYQTQIDRDSYMLIKEPFTQTISQYIQNANNLTDVSIQFLNILQNMQSLGFLLREWIKVDDFVVCMGKVKVQSMGIFTLDKNCGGISIKDAVAKVKQQMLEQIC